MDYITSGQIAEKYQVSVRTVHRMVKSGELVQVMKLHGVSGPRLFDPAAVERVFAAKYRPREPSAA